MTKAVTATGSRARFTPARVETKIETKVERVEVPVVEPAHLQALRAAVELLRGAADAADRASAGAAGAGTDALTAIREIEKTIDKAVLVNRGGRVQTAAKPPATPIRTAAPAKVPGVSYDDRSIGATNGSLAKGERICLIAIAQHAAGVTRQQLTTLAGYRRSTRDLYLQQLARLGYVEREGEQLVATEAGRAAIGPDFEPLPTGSYLLEHWRVRLPGGERKLLDVAVAAYPDVLDRATLGEDAGYQRSTRDLYIQTLLRRKLLEPAGKGQLRASALLFDL